MENSTETMNPKKQNILLVAEKLFAEHGYTATSTRMLAKESEVNLGMLSYYFGSKENLFQELVKTRIGLFRNEASDLLNNSETLWVSMEKIVNIYVDHFMDHAGFFRILHRELSLDSQTGLREHIMELIEIKSNPLLRALNLGIEKGVFRKVDVEMFSLSIVGILFQFITSEPMTRQTLKCNQNDSIFSEDYRNRIKLYLKDYISTFLKPW